MRASVLVIVLTAACRYQFDALGDASIDAVDDGPGLEAPTELTIRVVGDGALIGTGIECDGTCTVPRIGAVTLTPFAGQAWRLASLDNAICASGVCTVAADVTDVTATFERAPITNNIAFVSSVPAPLTTGLAAIDTFCQNRATAGGLPGSYIALLATGSNGLQVRLVGSRGWVRPDGLPVFDQVTLGVPTPRAILLNESSIPQPGFVVTGANIAGQPVGLRCIDWSAFTVQTDGGRAEYAGQFAVGGSIGGSCAERVYCLGVGLNAQVDVEVAFPMGRYIFTSSTPFVPGPGGIPAADARCQSEATAASLPGTYRALLASATQSAADHIGSLAGRWRRPDGVVVSRSGLVQPFDAAVNLDAARVPVTFGGFILIGAPTLTTTATMSCADWTTTGGVFHYGDPFSVTPYGLSSCCGSCSSGQLVCAQI